MRILIFLAVWKRPEITEICFMGIDRLRKSGLFHIEALAVISEDSMIELCNRYGIKWVFYKNEPLGEKKNFGLSEALKLEWDYLLEIGSDDLLKTEILEVYKKPIEDGMEFFGIKDVCYINSEDGNCRRYYRPQDTTAWGAGRMFKRSVFDKTGSKIWPDEINRSMDNSSTKFMFTKGVFHKNIPVERPLVVDVKSDTNIWPFNPDVGEAYNLEEAMEGLSEQEKTALINKMKKRHVETQVTH